MQTFIQKITSRKFLMGVTGVITGIVLLSNGNVAEGAATIISSILGYCIAEAYIDAKAVQSVIDTAKDVLDKVNTGEGESS